MHLKIIFLALSLFLPACAARHYHFEDKWVKKLPQSIEQQNRSLVEKKSFEIVAKVAFRHGNKGGNASLNWQQQNDYYFITLIGALGAGKVQIEGRSGHVEWRDSKGNHHVAKNPELLLDQLLGLKLPVSYLRYWIRGVAVPGIPSAFQINDEGHINTLKQAGWIIHYPQYGEQNLPQTVILEQQAIRIKIIIKNWNI